MAAMATKKKNIVVLSLGGSIMCPDAINTEFLKRFYKTIKKEIASGNRFVIIVGGGGLARKYQEAAADVSVINDEDKDWLGIHATRLNAHLLRTIFQKEAQPMILKRRKKVMTFGRRGVIIGAGWHPGWSTDYVAVRSALDFGAQRVIMLGKPAFVYDKDNQKYKSAKAFDCLSWKEYMKLIPARWKPGLHAPVDPVAARLAAQNKMEVIVARGDDLANVRNIIVGRHFRGTTIL